MGWDNAIPNIAQLTKNTLARCGWEVLPHPFRLDLAPSDSFDYSKSS